MSEQSVFPEWKSFLGSSTDKETKDFIKSVNEDFKSYIMDLSNRFGVANNRTKKLFLDRDLSYTDWVNPNIKPRTIKIGELAYL